jgi:hypothetical protein
MMSSCRAILCAEGDMIIVARARTTCSSTFKRPLSGYLNRAMTTKTIAVLDHGDLEDGQMYASSHHDVPHYHPPLIIAAGRKSRLILERFYCLVWVTKSMQPVHIALTMAPRSSKGSSQPMAGSSGESPWPLVLMHRH